jgi:hypothetical protein
MRIGWPLPLCRGLTHERRRARTSAEGALFLADMLRALRPKEVATCLNIVKKIAVCGMVCKTLVRAFLAKTIQPLHMERCGVRVRLQYPSSAKRRRLIGVER